MKYLFYVLLVLLLTGCYKLDSSNPAPIEEAIFGQSKPATAADYVGNFEAADDCDQRGNTGKYAVSISAESSTQFLLRNLANFSRTASVVVTLNGNRELTISRQTSAGGLVFEGVGVANSRNTLTINYTVRDSNGQTITCQATLQRQ